MINIKQFLVGTALVLALPLTAQEDNIFLSRDYWSNNPNVSEIKSEVEKGNDPTERNGSNFDPVVMAIFSNPSEDVIAYLLDQEGNDVNKLTHDGRTYIFWAASAGNLPLVKMFGERGAKMDIVDDHGYSVLNFAANAGVKDKELYDYLISKGSNPKVEKTHSGANALLLMMPSLTDYEMIEYFESKGLSIKDTDEAGNGVFNYAARSGNIEMMNKLIEKGVSYKEENKEGGNAMFFAAMGSRRSTNELPVFEYLKEVGVAPNVTKDDGTTPLHVLAARSKDMEVINFFVENGVNPTAENDGGNTPLLNASRRNKLEIIKFFAEKTENINATNEKGETALSLAVAGNSPEVVEYLMGEGAKTKFTDKSGNSLVYYLIDAYNPRNAEAFEKKMALLKKENVDFTKAQANDENFLTLAVKKNDLALIEKALATDIDVNTTDAEGNTPLQIAALRADNTKIMKLLLDHGANKEVTTDFGESVYDLASENEILQESNADLEFLKS
ncbi:ankyrin repeat domain-containing protein [Zunongwangia endophytica]|uniref:Ankyrin repeat domain-containing protein n=1 Tax=Zunongwangia endophytica TaxID=1808945 RepID=A0ABV8H4K6_9FLAO|nr:ankyrin repeat domain-containing protein [Zunongwangia endophytica]MDN3595471.1 ankyrin repeat domain-containing protein [Zunongwangia endophytica]